MLSLFGLYGGGVSALFDEFHFMNRDDALWSYITVCLIALLVIVAQFMMLDCMWQGCQCCSACCCSVCKCVKGEGCCGRCCFGDDSDDSSFEASEQIDN